jgi:hypothetical protein
MSSNGLPAKDDSRISQRDLSPASNLHAITAAVVEPAMVRERPAVRRKGSTPLKPLAMDPIVPAQRRDLRLLGPG